MLMAKVTETRSFPRRNLDGYVPYVEGRVEQIRGSSKIDCNRNY